MANVGSGGYFSNERGIRELAAFLRVDVDHRYSVRHLAEHLLALAVRDDDFMLDLLDGTLGIFQPGATADNLARALDIGGSVWTVAADRKGLVRVVSDEAQATYAAAISTADEASTELREAWANAFGRNGDPSDAWDHAIKAVEDVLIPVMMQNNGKATLSNVIGELSGQNSMAWRIILPGADKSHDVAPLVAMLRLLWPNHDRHGGNQKRTPAPEESRAVVTLAATIVQWHRDGWVVQRR
ncbi:hypothetical protein WN67_18685 [Mycolicibacterium obuense]|uniref:Uncharacterized protein n=2 Tax=Mycolicibacterium obuense TaxID=1807 RepID=A0A0M2JV57_9MYCO|nr:hypothetical protein WN67_18685 [Mycolicibacterium obuense]